MRNYWFPGFVLQVFIATDLSKYTTSGLEKHHYGSVDTNRTLYRNSNLCLHTIYQGSEDG